MFANSTYTSLYRWYLSINRYNSKPVAILAQKPPALAAILMHDSGIEIQTVSNACRSVALAKKPYVFLALVIVVSKSKFCWKFLLQWNFYLYSHGTCAPGKDIHHLEKHIFVCKIKHCILHFFSWRGKWNNIAAIF